MKLTVVIPVYNGAKRVLRLLNSLIHQTFKDFKVLLIDDGSKDDSAEAISRFIEEHGDDRFELIRQENVGVSLTRDRGIQSADSEYITFIDQDDYIAEDYCERYISIIEESGADIVCGGYQRISEEGKVLRRIVLSQDEWSKFVVVAPWAHVYRTAFLKENHIGFLKTGIGEDVYFSLLAYAYTNKIVITDYCGYYWVYNVESVSNSKQKKVSKKLDPFILLNALDKDVPKENCISPELMEYYLFRYIVWYLLFTARGTQRSVLLTQYAELIKWLEKRYPKFYRNRNISLLRPNGEPFTIRLSVWASRLMYRIHLMPTFLRLIAAKDE